MWHLAYWGLIMRSKFAGAIVSVALIMAVFQSPAIATTYNYVGNFYTYGFNPASSLGTNMTASVTFDFDTSGYTGTVNWVDG